MGDRAPLGICGSGIIDAVAELLKAGVIGQNGRFNPDVASPRVRHPEGAAEYVPVEAQYSGTGSDIVVSETDIDNVIRAKAAMFAGVQTLLESVMLSWNDLSRPRLPGGFPGTTCVWSRPWLSVSFPSCPTTGSCSWATARYWERRWALLHRHAEDRPQCGADDDHRGVERTIQRFVDNRAWRPTSSCTPT